jgi:hypothetical protein
MNIREHRELGEALKHFAFGLPLVAEQKGAGVPNYVQDALTVINAARLTYDRYQECDCDDGKVMQPHDHEANCWEECVCGAVYEIHPSCGGSGLQPNQARRRQAAIDLIDATPDEWDREPDWLQRNTLESVDIVVRAFDKETNK